MDRITAALLIVLGTLLVHPGFTDQSPGTPSGNSEAGTIGAGIKFDSERISWLVAPEGVRNRMLDQEPAGAMTGRVLHSIRDFNADGIDDIGIFELRGGSLKKMHSSYQLHFGNRTSNGETNWPAEFSTEIRSDGIPFEIQLADFDDDGQIDVSLMVIDPGLYKTIGMITSSIFRRSISLDLELYRLDNGRYPSSPNATRKVRTVKLGGSGEPAAIYPAVNFMDFDGDGHTDLLVQDGPGGHLLFPGTDEDGLFTKKPQPFEPAASGEQTAESGRLK